MSDFRVGPERADDREAAAIASFIAVVGPADVYRTERIVEGGPAAAAARRHLLLPGLWALQDAVGWISPGGLNSLCLALGIAPADAYGVASFYDLFVLGEPPPVIERRCTDLVCGLSTSPGTDAEPSETSTCLGQCDHGAATLWQRRGRPVEVTTTHGPGREPVVVGAHPPRLLRRGASGPVLDIDSYRSDGGFAALARATELGPGKVIDEIVASGLRGRGGAAFPTGMKWKAVASAEGDDRHVVANADESEPGTFKDRVLMERDPFSLIEGLMVCGLAVGARRGWIYVRGEYVTAHDRLLEALDQCRHAGLLGDRFDIELRRGAGAYICGEETALLESIEGYRGEPRPKPPYPTARGLFGSPTVINNVETLAHTLDVLVLGATQWRSVGTADSPGTRLFCLSGQVARPGVYEHPLGVSLADVLEAAGGVRDGADLQAIVLGGAAGTLVGPDRLDIELSFEGARAAEVTLGSGAVIVLDTSADLRALVRRAAQFFAHESCGQCVPCREGTRRQLHVIDRVPIRHDLLDDLDRVMTDASICGLGQSAASLVRSARKLGVL